MSRRSGRRWAGVWILGLALLTVACGASTGVPRPRPFPTPGGRTTARLPPLAPSAPATPFASALLDTALALRGTPYRNGGDTPAGFDCSGYVWYVFARHGVHVPRTVSEQFDSGLAVDPRRLAAGDLVFFDTGGGRVTHVAIALGDGRFVHAPSSRGAVRVESLAAGYWARRFVGVRRVGPDAAAGGAATPPGGVPYR